MKKSKKPLIESLLNDSSFKNWATESNKNDIAFWNSWIKKHPEQVDDIYTAKTMVLGISFNQDPISEKKVNDELSAVLNRINKNALKKASRKSRILSSRIVKYASIAAIGLVLMTVGSIMLNNSKEVVHKTGYGEIINLRLPDGTSVVLNGNSEIRYDKENPRKVMLDGEAYFKVKKVLATNPKFWVSTSDLTVEVYGTEFNVNSREERTNVLLDEGSIHLLLKNGESKKMVPGEFVSYSNEDNSVLHEKVNNSLTYSSWREGTYTFNNITLEDLMKYLEHTYGLSSEFVIDSLKGKTISGGIPNENLEICLNAIQKSTGVKILQEDNKLLIFNN